MKQEIEQEKMTRSYRENENLYLKAMLNDVYTHENKMAYMENWSILSDNIRYVNHDEGPKTTCSLDVKTLDYQQHKKLYFNLKGEESHTIDIDLGHNPETMK